MTKCKNCGQEKDTHNDRNPWNDCKQFISSKEEKAIVNDRKLLLKENKGCGKTIKRICKGGENVPYCCGGDKLCPSCSSNSSRTTLKDKDPDVSVDLNTSNSSGSDFVLSDKIVLGGILVKDIAEAVRKLKEELQPLRYGIRVEQLNRIHQMIDKIFGEFK